MARRNDAESGAGRVLRLAPAFDSSRLKLTAEEGFLLSRVDGQTPVDLLAEMAGMEFARASARFSDWLELGLLEEVACASDLETEPGAAPREGPEAVTVAFSVDESQLDPQLDIDIATQRRILAFESQLAGSYHERLGVEPGADDRAIKKAYFALSREFHPDRFFRCELGPYANRLSSIFKHILEAYEALSVPRPAAGKASETSQPGPLPETDAGPSALEREARPDLEKLERLSQRTSQSLPPGLRRERQQKAQAFDEASRESANQGRLREAVTSLRLAIQFDPDNVGYRRRLAKLKARVLEVQVLNQLEDSRHYGAMSEVELDRTMKSLEQLLENCPKDPELNERAALVALARDDTQRARIHAETAVEGSPEKARFHTLLGRVHGLNGHAGHARREFELALACDPGDKEARSELDGLLRRHGLSMPGGARG